MFNGLMKFLFPIILFFGCIFGVCFVAYLTLRTVITTWTGLWLHVGLEPWGVFFVIVGVCFGVSARGFDHLGGVYATAARRLGGDKYADWPDDLSQGTLLTMAMTVGCLGIGTYAIATNALSLEFEGMLFSCFAVYAICAGIWMKLRNPNGMDAKLTMRDGQPVADTQGRLNLRLTRADKREIDVYNAQLIGRCCGKVNECKHIPFPRVRTGLDEPKLQWEVTATPMESEASRNAQANGGGWKGWVWRFAKSTAFANDAFSLAAGNPEPLIKDVWMFSMIGRMFGRR